VALLRRGNDHAFEAIVDRYQARLLGFCRQMLSSTEDAEDVLQEVFVNAHRAILADDREIKLRPWLYRIARNRCLNLLRKPVAEGKDTMDTHPMVDAASTHERVQNREEFRQLLGDVQKLPETQRTALLLREMDAMSYEEIAEAMQTTVPSVKSLLVRARIALAEATQARLLTCGEVRLELAEAAEGLGKASGPVRRHVRECESCGEFRDQLRSDSKVLAALFPATPLLLLKGVLLSKLGIGGASASGGAGAASAGGAGAGAGGAAIGGGAAGGGIGVGGAIGGAIGTKAVAGVVTAAVITAGAAVEVKKVSHPAPAPAQPALATGGVTAPPAVTTHLSSAARHPEAKAGARNPGANAKNAAAGTTAQDPATTTDPDATGETTNHKHPSNPEAGASTTNSTVAVVVTETPTSTTTVTTGPAPGSPPPGSSGDHQPPPPPPPAATEPEDPPAPPPPGEEPTPPPAP
jgi:RNA polymerase sigma factor (sigma-70 family)